jgi:hypothetical protein
MLLSTPSLEAPSPELGLFLGLSWRPFRLLEPQVLMSGCGPSRQAAFFGPTVANGPLRTWLGLQLAAPCRE